MTALEIGLLKVGAVAEALEWTLMQVISEAEVPAPELAERLKRWRLFIVKVQGACLAAGATAGGTTAAEARQ
jgi:hypothetical protein